jgi:hypothetical protein
MVYHTGCDEKKDEDRNQKLLSHKRCLWPLASSLIVEETKELNPFF